MPSVVSGGFHGKHLGVPEARTLAELTTLHLGGPAGRLVECTDERELVVAIREADAQDVAILVLGGGSNLVVSDAGFPGTVLRVQSSGIACTTDGNQAVVEVQAGEGWDRFVERCVAQSLAGVECLSGIPGLVGATPIQNVGAYGQETSGVVLRVRVYDRKSREIYELGAQECAFSYRSSIFKRNPGRWVVLAVTYRLSRQEHSLPLLYAELARSLGVEVGQTAPLGAVRDAVLALRRRKGMVLDASDPDTVSAGSFFLNPVLEASAFERLQQRVEECLGPDVRAPRFPQDDGTIKTSAAWLIERAGFRRGYGAPNGIAISSKHTLALTNRGHGTTERLVALASEIITGVRTAFGIELAPEPVLVGVALNTG